MDETEKRISHVQTLVDRVRSSYRLSLTEKQAVIWALRKMENSVYAEKVNFLVNNGSLIIESFSFSSTTEGSDFWYDVHNKVD